MIDYIFDHFGIRAISILDIDQYEANIQKEMFRR